MYASSITTSPLKLFRTISISCRSIELAVGLFGLQIELEIVEKPGPSHLHVVDVRAYLVHPIRRRIDDHIVPARHAESAIKQIYTFIAPVPQEDVLRADALDLADGLLHLPLMRIGITVIPFR